MTIEQIESVEPRVAAIFKEAAAAQNPDWHSYEYFKGRLSVLVGWQARNPWLATPAAYDCCIKRLVEVLGL